MSFFLGGGGRVTGQVGVNKLNDGRLWSKNELEVKLFSMTTRPRDGRGKKILGGYDKCQGSWGEKKYCEEGISCTEVIVNVWDKEKFKKKLEPKCAEA